MICRHPEGGAIGRLRVFSMTQISLRSFGHIFGPINGPPILQNDFFSNKLLPAEAEKYLHHIVNKEMPAGMKRHLEVELFPHPIEGQPRDLHQYCTSLDAPKWFPLYAIQEGIVF